MKSNVTENDIKKSCDNFQRILYYAIKMSTEESQLMLLKIQGEVK